MFKKALALFLSVLLLLSTTACTKDTNSKVGKDFVTIYVCTQVTDSAGNIETEFEYDKYGNPTLAIEYAEGQEIERCEFVYAYDKNGNVTQVVYYIDNKEGRHTEYTYDNDGNLISEVFYFPGQEDNRAEYKYEYDRHGNMVQKTYYRYGQESSRTVYEYDSHGNIVQQTNYDDSIVFENGQKYQVYEYEYEYDSEGNITKEVYYHDPFRTEYYYDQSGRPTLRIIYNNNRESSRTEYNYNGDLCDFDNGQYKKLCVSKNQAKRLQNDNDYIIICK